MRSLRRYRMRPDRFVAAVQLNLQTEGFTVRKWGADQRCKPGDWLVDNEGDVYSVDAEVFTRTYRKRGTGAYLKATPVRARVAEEAGEVATKEGRSHYDAGDYIVYNNQDGTDGYCMSAAKFASLYEPDE